MFAKFSAYFIRGIFCKRRNLAFSPGVSIHSTHKQKKNGVYFTLKHLRGPVLKHFLTVKSLMFALVSGRVLFGGNMKELEILHAVK